jgi:5'-methylthioadenosine phosphorylase
MQACAETPKIMPRDTFAVIGGSGAQEIIRADAQCFKRLGPAPTPFGLSAPLYRVRMNEAHFLFMPRHGDTGEELAAPWVNYRASIYALKEQGASRIMAWSAPAAVNVALTVGQYVLPHDLVDDTRGRESSFFKGTGLGGLRQRPVFCDETRAAAESVLRMLSIKYQPHGAYVCAQGPRLETPAEVKRLRSWGGDMVGMTLAPEAFLARELEMCYLPLCCIGRYGEGIREREGKPGRVLEEVQEQAEREALAQSLGFMLEIVARVSRAVPDEPRCACAQAMEQYRKEGRIGDDWHTWIGRP